MSIAHFFIDRPVFASVISIVTIIAGALAILALPISQYPEIAPPTVTVTTVYPGANAKTVSETVATPLEEQINGVEHMLYMSSQSTNDGSMTLTISFQVGTNLDVAQVQVQNRVAIAQPDLPQEVQQQGITIKKASPDITVVVAILSPDNSHDTVFMSNYATLQIKDQIARLPGVGDITIFGVRDFAMRLWLDPDKLAARSLTAGDVVKAIQEQNVQVAAGIIGGPPLPAGTSQFQYTMNVEGRLTKPEEFNEMIVNVGNDGRTTLLKDVGRAELAAADYSTAMTFNGRPAVAMAIFQLPGTNAIETAKAIYKKMDQLKKRFPQGVDYNIPYDTTRFVNDSIRDVVVTLFESVGLVALVVLVFLQSWRTSLVPLAAIPVSLIGTFAVLWVAGFSLNILSLFGIVLAIGIVVDDAIVVIENVERWVEQGLSPRDAAFKAMDEVTPAVVAIAFGLSAVFIPVAFVSGITGQFYRQFALTISFATLLSAFNSLTLSPALAALLLRPRGARQDWLTRGLNFLLGWFFHLFNKTFDTSNRVYIKVLRKVVRLSAFALIAYLGLCFLAYKGMKLVPTGFIPAQDQGYLIVNVQMPDASSIDRTEAVLTRMSEAARKTPGVRGAFTVAGLSILTRSNSSAAGVMFTPLIPFDQRVGHPEMSYMAIAGRLQQQFAAIQEAQILVFPPPPVRGIGSAGGFKLQIQDRSGLGTPQQLEAVTQRVIAEASKRPELVGLFSGFRASFPQIYGNVDRVKAKQQKVAVTDIFQALQVYLGGLYVNDFNYLGRTWHVTAQADAPFRSNASSISRIQTRNANGQMVPLGDFEWTDLAYQEELAGNTALLIFPLCILFVWLTHSAEYESFALSTAIILIVPMCLLCGIWGVWLRHMDNNIFTQIGFIVLAGMSVKNAVLIVEFAKQQQENNPGMRAADAAIEAARLRLRPILMTSFTFIFGVLPLLVATGAGAEMRQAMGTAVFFGMLGVTFFGVFFTPVFYTVIQKLVGHDVMPAHPAHARLAQPAAQLAAPAPTSNGHDGNENAHPRV
jgi:hydrophobe/amphiphile efflux-1 (HAE1) family protein